MILLISPSSPQWKAAPLVVSARRYLQSCRSTLEKEEREVAQPRKALTSLVLVGLGYLASPDILSGSGSTPFFEITIPAKLIFSVLY